MLLYTGLMFEAIPRQPGTYLLIFRSEQSTRLDVGRVGSIQLQVGYYLYVGSAFGPGGLQARVRHHAKISTRPHWHLDYIRPALSLTGIAYSTDMLRYEHAWAGRLYYTRQMAIPLRSLGASDCRCESHFFYTQDEPITTALRKTLGDNNNNTNITFVDLL